MPVSLDNLLVVGISSRALFDLEAEEAIFRTQGLDAYRQHQLQHENEIFTLPDWIALEVSDDARYYNSNLSKDPYKNWPG